MLKKYVDLDKIYYKINVGSYKLIKIMFCNTKCINNKCDI